MPGPVPVSVSRPARQGKIRWGIRNAKGWPQAIDTFRFTSPDKVAIEVLAGLYGGSVSSWNEPKATEKNQWQVISESNEVNVWVVPGQLWKGYEYWQGGVCVRRCDGVTLSKLEDTADGSDHLDMNCLCDAAQEMTCKPKLRMQVILPEVPMGGVWSIESNSWNAWHEMPDLVNMLELLQGQNRSIEPARLLLTDQSKVVKQAGKVFTKRFKVPKLILPRTAQQIRDDVLLAPVVEVIPYVPEARVIEVESKVVPVVASRWASLAEAIRDGHKREDLTKTTEGWLLK